MPAGLASSRPAPASTTIPSCIISYACWLKAFIPAPRTDQGLSGRRLLGSLEQLRVTGLLNGEHHGSSHHYTSCSIGGTVRACQENPGRVKARGVRRQHKRQHRQYSSCLSGEPGSSKRPEEFGDCVSCSIGGTVRAFQENPGQVKARGGRRLHELQHRRHSSCLPGEPRSSKDPRSSEIVQTAASAAQFVPARRTRVEQRLEAC